MPIWKVTAQIEMSIEVDAPSETAAREIVIAEPLEAWDIKGGKLRPTLGNTQAKWIRNEVDQ